MDAIKKGLGSGGLFEQWRQSLEAVGETGESMTRKLSMPFRVVVVSCLLSSLACGDHRPVGAASEATPTAPKGVASETSSARSLNTSDSAVRAKMNPQLRAKLDQIRSTPRYKELSERLFRINARGSLAVAFSGEALPGDIIGYAYLAQVGDPSRYAVFSSSNFDDEIYQHVTGAAFSYEMAHEEDRSPVKLTIHSDDTVEIESQALGRSIKMQRFTAHITDPRRVSGPLLKRAATIAPEVLGSHRQVRVIRVNTRAQ